MKKIHVLLTLLFSAFLLSSCAPKMIFGISTITPGAEGYAKVTTSKNGNYVLQVKVINLTEPQRLTPMKRVYSIWAETDMGSAKNLGMMKVSTGLFSKTYKGEFKTVCITKPTRVFITAEDNGDAQYPGPIVVLKTE
jgi:hypothetical protein